MFCPSGFWTMALLRYAAKFDPFLSLDCDPTPSTLDQSKERKGSNFAIWQQCPPNPAIRLDTSNMLVYHPLLPQSSLNSNCLKIRPSRLRYRHKSHDENYGFGRWSESELRRPFVGTVRMHAWDCGMAGQRMLLLTPLKWYMN